MVPPAQELPGAPRQGSARDLRPRTRRAGAVPARIGDLAHRLLHPWLQLLPVRAGAARGRSADVLPRHGGPTTWSAPACSLRAYSGATPTTRPALRPKRSTGCSGPAPRLGGRARCLAPDRRAVPSPVSAGRRGHGGRCDRGAGRAAQGQVAERDGGHSPRRRGRRSRHGRGRGHRAGRHHGAGAGRGNLRGADPGGKRHAGPRRPLLRRTRLPPPRQLHRPRACNEPDRPVRGAGLCPVTTTPASCARSRSAGRAPRTSGWPCA